MKKVLPISFLIFTFLNVKAQRPETGAWLAVQVPVNFSQHWQWHNDGSYRTLGISAAPLHYLYRTGIRYFFNQHWSTAAGIAFFFKRTSYTINNKEFGQELRLWQEIIHQQQLNKKWQWQLRFRTEQRFFDATSVKSNYTAYRFRLRNGFTQTLNNKWSIQMAHEYMQQQALQKFSFEQNRLIAMGIYHFNQQTQLAGSYMWVLWPTEDQHIVSLSFIKNISIHGNKSN